MTVRNIQKPSWEAGETPPEEVCQSREIRNGEWAHLGERGKCVRQTASKSLLSLTLRTYAVSPCLHQTVGTTLKILWRRWKVMQVQNAAFLRCAWVLGGNFHTHNPPYRRALWNGVKHGWGEMKFTAEAQEDAYTRRAEGEADGACKPYHVPFCTEIRNQEEFGFWPQFQMLGNQEPLVD